MISAIFVHAQGLFLEGLCYTICCLCNLSSVSTDGGDGHGLKLEKLHQYEKRVKFPRRLKKVAVKERLPLVDI